MRKFLEWLNEYDPAVFKEFVNVGQSEDWTDIRATTRRVNDERYADRGIRSKYVANMKVDKNRKRKR